MRPGRGGGDSRPQSSHGSSQGTPSSRRPVTQQIDPRGGGGQAPDFFDNFDQPGRPQAEASMHVRPQNPPAAPKQERPQQPPAAKPKNKLGNLFG